MPQCAKCREETPEEEGYDYKGQFLCEDCYMEVLQPPKC
jgi:formylmethanofuran dehydrogenase subunit E